MSIVRTPRLGPWEPEWQAWRTDSLGFREFLHAAPTLRELLAEMELL